MQNLIYSLEVVAPVFLIVYLGIFLRKRNFINENFIDVSSNIVFIIALPALTFLKISETNFNEVFDLKVIAFACAMIVLSFVIAWFISFLFTSNGGERGSFIQGSFRGNDAIIGFALILSIFGETALAKAAVILIFIMPLFNVLAVIALTVPRRNEQKAGYGKILYTILQNPLIISAAAALPFSYFQIPIPKILIKTGDYLAVLTLPLALLGIGGSLNFRASEKRSGRRLPQAS